MLGFLSNWQKGVIFYVLTLIMAVAVVIFGPDSNGRLQILNMLTPTVGVLLLLLVVTPDGYHRSGWAGLALHRPGWRAWPLALIAPTAILCVSYGVAWLVGVLSWNFESDMLINLIIAILINSVFAIFEEIGWRGYLLPHFGAPGSFGAASARGVPARGVAPAADADDDGVQPGREPAHYRTDLPGGADRRGGHLRLPPLDVRQHLAGDHRARNLQCGAGKLRCGGRYARRRSRCVPHWRDWSIHLGRGRDHRICLGQTLPISSAQPSPMSGSHRLANTWPQTGARGGHRRPEPAATASNRSGKRDKRSHTTRICCRLLLHLTGYRPGALTVALSRTRSAGRLPPAPGRELGGLAARPGVDSSWMPRPLLVRERDHVLNER